MSEEVKRECVDMWLYVYLTERQVDISGPLGAGRLSSPSQAASATIVISPGVPVLPQWTGHLEGESCSD